MDTEGTVAYGTSWTQENNHNISSEENQVRALGMSHDGLYAFVAGDENGKIIRYALGTAWDLSSITGTPVQATIDSNPRGMAFNADGTLIFILYSGGTLKKYSPDSAYDIATLGSADQTKTSLGSLVGLHFKPDGTEFYSTLGSTGVKQFTLGSAWDISGATGGSTKAVSGENDPTDVWISSDGTKMFVCGYGNDEVVKYTMPAWDIGNSTADSTEFGVPANPFGLVFKPDGTKFILAVDDTSTDKLYEYKGGKSCPNDFSSTSDLEALTGVRTNSIFQQTDVPEYYWYNGTSWLRDGSPPLGNNLHAWYDASDSSSVTKDSSNLVSQLNDKSGNGYNLTASGTGTGGQPLWVSGGKNDLDIVDFGSSKQMKAQWTAKSQPVTYVAFMFSPASDGSQDNFWDNYDNTNSSMGFANVDTSNNLSAYAPTNLGSISSTNYTQKWGLFTVIYNTTSSEILINGDQKASGDIGTNSSYGITLSCHRTSATYGQIKLAEMLIYDKVLSSDELTTINNYFVNKWGAVLE